jgi:hypothetical protein
VHLYDILYVFASSSKVLGEQRQKNIRDRCSSFRKTADIASALVVLGFVCTEVNFRRKVRYQKRIRALCKLL